MFYFLKQSKTLLCFTNFLIFKNRYINTIKPYVCFVSYASQFRFYGPGQNKCLLVSNDQSRLILSRNKYDNRKKKKAKSYGEDSSDEEDEDEDHDDDDDIPQKGSETNTYKVKNLRVDALLKVVLGVSRKRLEESFYSNKIRVNGQILYKKSQNVKLNDEIDLIKGTNDEPLDTITVGRIKILKLDYDPDSEHIILKAWRKKSLTIKNYEDKNAWRDPVK